MLMLVAKGDQIEYFSLNRNSRANILPLLDADTRMIYSTIQARSKLIALRLPPLL